MLEMISGPGTRIIHGWVLGHGPEAELQRKDMTDEELTSLGWQLF